MSMQRREIKPHVFPIGEVDYVVPQVGIDTGQVLVELLGKSQAELSKSKTTPEQLFKMVVSYEVWEQMRADGVPFTTMTLVGMASLAYFQVIAGSTVGSPAGEEAAVRARDEIWNSGLDPQTLGAGGAGAAAPPRKATPAPATAPARKKPAKKLPARAR